MENKKLEQLVREFYPSGKIVSAKKIGRMKLKMSRIGAVSWQWFRDLDMVETDSSYIFDLRGSLVRSQKRIITVSAVLFVLSIFFTFIYSAPVLSAIALPVSSISLFGIVVSPINILLYRRMTKIITIMKSRVQASEIRGQEHILSGMLQAGDPFSIVADIRESRSRGTIGYNARFTIRYVIA